MSITYSIGDNDNKSLKIDIRKRYTSAWSSFAQVAGVNSKGDDVFSMTFLHKRDSSKRCEICAYQGICQFLPSPLNPTKEKYSHYYRFSTFCDQVNFKISGGKRKDYCYCPDSMALSKIPPLFKELERKIRKFKREDTKNNQEALRNMVIKLLEEKENVDTQIKERKIQPVPLSSRTSSPIEPSPDYVPKQFLKSYNYSEIEEPKEEVSEVEEGKDKKSHIISTGENKGLYPAVILVHKEFIYGLPDTSLYNLKQILNDTINDPKYDESVVDYIFRLRFKSWMSDEKWYSLEHNLDDEDILVHIYPFHGDINILSNDFEKSLIDYNLFFCKTRNDVYESFTLRDINLYINQIIK